MGDDLSLQFAQRWLSFTALLGVTTWLIVWWVHLSSLTTLDEIELLLYFGVSVTTPLAMRLALQPDRHNQIYPIYRLGIRLHPLAVVSLGFALLLEPGPLAAGLAGVWQLQTVLLAGYGLQRLLSRPTFAIEEVCVDAGLIYMPVSGVWLIAYVTGQSLLTFDNTIVLLTAVHFTFISPGALVLAGMAGRQLYLTSKWYLYRPIAFLTIVSPLLVAVGITVTQVSGFLLVETVAVLVLAGSFLVLGIVVIAGGLPRQIMVRGLIILSLAALVITMGLALAYSLGRLTNWWGIPMGQMVQWHGWLNAFGFTFLGLLAWNRATPVQRATLPGIPFSHLPWRWQIGPDFLQRISAIAINLPSNPTGIVDRLQDYERADFDTTLVAAAVKNFYEDTASHELLVSPEWQPKFRFLARIYKQISLRLGQMNFPLRAETAETHISSQIIPLRDELDGRKRVRGWVRTYTETGQAVYVAAYSSHCFVGCRYMNIAFPLPFGNLTSILRLEIPVEQDGGVFLTSYSKRGADQGVYFVSRLVTIRLPINETIRVYPTAAIYEDYPSNFPRGDLIAKHEMRLLGLHFLTLHYRITRISRF